MQTVLGVMHFLRLDVQDFLSSALLLLPLPVVQMLKSLAISKALSIRSPRLRQSEMNKQLCFLFIMAAKS